MDDQSAFFDEAVQAKGVGRRLVHETIRGSAKLLFAVVPGVVQKKVDSLITSAPLVRPAPKIIGGVTNDHRFNACAFKYNDAYVIAVNWGTLIVLGDLAHRLMCIPEVFPWIGNPSSMALNGVFPPIKCDSAADVQAFLNARLLFVPRDVRRQQSAEMLAAHLLGFLVWHELRHMAAGHIDYLESEYGVSSLREFEAHGPLAEQAMVLQAMETDADEFATRLNMGEMLTLAETREQRADWVRWLLRDELDAVEVASVCAYLMFRVLDSPLGRVEDWTDLDHPPDIFRQLSVIKTATHVLAREQYADVGSRTWNDSQWKQRFFNITEKVFAARFGGTFCFTNWHRAVGPDGDAHRKKIDSCWNALLPSLSQFSYMKLV